MTSAATAPAKEIITAKVGQPAPRAAGEFGVGVLKTALEKMFPENAMSAKA